MKKASSPWDLGEFIWLFAGGYPCGTFSMLVSDVRYLGRTDDLRHEDMVDLRCMSFTSKGTSEILAAGLQESMFVIDLAKGQVVKQVRLY